MHSYLVQHQDVGGWRLHTLLAQQHIKASPQFSVPNGASPKDEPAFLLQMRCCAFTNTELKGVCTLVKSNLFQA